MTSWFVLLIVQTALVGRGRTDVHRRLGVAGGAIAVMVVVLTIVAAIIGLRVPRGIVAIDPTLVVMGHYARSVQRSDVTRLDEIGDQLWGAFVVIRVRMSQS